MDDIESLATVLSETKREDQIIMADLKKKLAGALSENDILKGGLSGAEKSIEFLEMEIDERTKQNSRFLEEFTLREDTFRKDLVRARVEATTATLDQKSQVRTTKKELLKCREDLAETCDAIKDLRGRNRDLFEGRQRMFEQLESARKRFKELETELQLAEHREILLRRDQETLSNRENQLKEDIASLWGFWR